MRVQVQVHLGAPRPRGRERKEALTLWTLMDAQVGQSVRDVPLDRIGSVDYITRLPCMGTFNFAADASFLPFYLFFKTGST